LGVLRIEVTDSGTGMAETDLKKLFTRFSQVSLDSTQRQSGTGLGLFITKEIIKGLNGDIKAFSKVGQGSSFVGCFPVYKEVPNNNIVEEE